MDIKKISLLVIAKIKDNKLKHFDEKIESNPKYKGFSEDIKSFLTESIASEKKFLSHWLGVSRKISTPFVLIFPANKIGLKFLEDSEDKGKDYSFKYSLKNKMYYPDFSELENIIETIKKGESLKLPEKFAKPYRTAK
ncbi:hypothetical protein N9948_01275 [bacterium]|nr:hypothetical protein [bacterium]